MASLYGRWIHRWERRLHDTQRNGRPARTCRPFEWGGEWVGGAPGVPAPVVDPAQSHDLFSYTKPDDYKLDNGWLTFSSPLDSPHAENNTVHARWFPAASRKRAVVVIPQWNSDEQGHMGLCR